MKVIIPIGGGEIPLTTNKIDEYIPKLKDIINKNKNKSKDMER